MLDRDDALHDVAAALDVIGYARLGKPRIFAHPSCSFTVDFPKGPLAVGGEYIHTTGVLQSGQARLRILTRVDCVPDRLAHVYFWDHYTALNPADAHAPNHYAEGDLENVRAWTERESTDLREKFREFEKRLRKER